MKFPLNSPIIRGLAIALAISSLTSNARANVYATNIKLNGSTNNPTIVVGQNVSISYILNEPASAGVTIGILSGTNVVRTISVPAGNPGPTLGTNTVTWNGKNDADAKKFLQCYCFYTLPIANKDGVARGGTRFNLQGKDLNRNWDKSSDPQLAPENYALEKWLERMIHAGQQPHLPFCRVHGFSTLP